MKTPARLIALSLLFSVASQTVQAGGDVRLYRADETPNPHEIAAMLERDTRLARPIKFRSIRLLPTQVASAAPVPNDDSAGPSGFALPVQFAFDSAKILPQATRQLDAVAEGIKLAGSGTKVTIEGHTDAVGSAQYNKGLSHRRAVAVKEYLVQYHGIAPTQLRTVGLGMNRPFDESNPFAGENRRVEFRAASQGA